MDCGNGSTLIDHTAIGGRAQFTIRAGGIIYRDMQELISVSTEVRGWGMTALCVPIAHFDEYNDKDGLTLLYFIYASFQVGDITSLVVLVVQDLLR